jgi:hypothetical protein
MSVKTPIRTVFDGSGNATGLAEYQSGEFIGLTHGGIGASLSIGSAGQVLKVNNGGSALEFGNVEAVLNIDGMTDGSAVALVAGDKIPFSDAGAEKFTTPANIDTFITTTTQTLQNKTISSANNTLTISGAQATLTAIGNSSLTNSSFNIVDDSSTTSTISLGESLKIAGTSNEIETSISGDQVTIGLPNNVVIGNNLNVTGTITGDVTGDVTGNADTATVLATARTIAGKSFNGSGNITIAATDLSDTDQALAQASNVTFANLTLSGNLTVNGTTSTVASTNTTISDNLLELNSGAGSNANDSGILIERGSTGDNAIIAWDESADKFIVGTTTATNTSTGNLTIATATLVANLEGAVTGNASTATALANARTIAGQSFDGTGNITIASTDLSNTSAIALLTATQTMTNKTLTSPKINEDVAVTATATELNFVDGVTSAIQTQLDTKAAKSFAIAQSIALG